MKKSTKGALAASAAALLLLGGLGTHATWSDDETIDGTGIQSGHLNLVPSCAAWTLNDLVTALTASDRLVPGDVLTRKCTITVDIEGVMTATLSAEDPKVLVDGTSTEADGVDPEAVFEVNGATVTGATQLHDDDVIDATITVTLPKNAATLVTEDLQATLDDVTVTATQA